MAPPGGGVGPVLPGEGAPCTCPPGVGVGVVPEGVPFPGIAPPEGVPPPGAACAWLVRASRIGAARISQMNRCFGFMRSLWARDLPRRLALGVSISELVERLSRLLLGSQSLLAEPEL